MKDYHLHSDFGDGRSTVDEMARAAKAAGFREIAFTEHFTWLFSEFRKMGRKGGVTIRREQIGEFFRQCAQAEQKYGIRVLKGLEIGYLEQDKAATKRLVETVHPDIVLLAVHHLELLEEWKREERVDLKGYSIYLSPSSVVEFARQFGGFDRFCRAYFDRLNHAIRAGFDDLCAKVGVAHLVVFARSPLYQADPPHDMIEECLALIASKGLALEVNFHHFQEGQTPSRPPFAEARRFLDLGGNRVWFGSDAHGTEEVAKAAGDYHVFEQQMRVG
ncbi:MAG: PHP domain-containing protein [Kiritimatiellae bacterium]|nr:PHP domain-containing protein [Kiritimatiellia bacterium]